MQRSAFDFLANFYLVYLWVAWGAMNAILDLVYFSSIYTKLVVQHYFFIHTIINIIIQSMVYLHRVISSLVALFLMMSF